MALHDLFETIACSFVRQTPMQFSKSVGLGSNSTHTTPRVTSFAKCSNFYLIFLPSLTLHVEACKDCISTVERLTLSARQFSSLHLALSYPVFWIRFKYVLNLCKFYSTCVAVNRLLWRPKVAFAESFHMANLLQVSYCRTKDFPN